MIMGTYPPPGPGGVGRRIEEAIELIEMELRHAIAYVNDAVIPQVRRESISAMRTWRKRCAILRSASKSQLPRTPGPEIQKSRSKSGRLGCLGWRCWGLPAARITSR